MGGTCSCESNDNYNVETYYSVNGSKSYRVKTKSDIFEDKLGVKISLDDVIKKNMIVKIQKSIRKYLYKLKHKIKESGVKFPRKEKSYIENNKKLSENVYATFGMEEKSNQSNYSIHFNKSTSNLSRTSIIFHEEKLIFLDQIENGNFSQGNLNQPKKEGYGKLILKDSTQILGMFRQSKLNGFVQVNTKQEEYFNGQLTNFSAYGFGIYSMNKVVEYVGYWQDNTKNGYGIETRFNHSIYSGDFEKGKKQGFGILKLAEGSNYIGYFKENNFNGYGNYTFSDGREFSGEWKNSNMEGYGEFLWKDGNKYCGYYVADKKEGFGVFYWPSSSKIFVGFWKNGKQEGIGKKITHSRVKYSLFKSGKIVHDYESVGDALNELEKEQKCFLHFFDLELEEIIEFFN